MNDAPTYLEPGPAGLTRAQGASPGIAPGSILIVDDMPDKHLVFRAILEDLGQPIVGVRCGREALALLLEHEFSVILLDVNMPGMDGLETAGLIRRHRRSAATPILFVTAYADEVQARRGYALGAVDYITSPVAPEVLRSKVKVFVELFRMNRQLQLHAAEREALARAQAARAAAEAAQARADFLAQASEALGRSLEPGPTRETLLALAVPRLARMATLLEPDDAQALARQPGSRRERLARALSSGEAACWECAGADLAALPLQPHGRGPVLLLEADGGTLDEPQLALARELVGRAAIAMENARLYAAVREADRRKNEFLAMLAHELRNPLAPIRNAVHIMHGAADAPATLAWARDVIARQADHMTRLIDDLLDVSRIVQGKVAVRPEKLLLSAVIDRCQETTAPRLQARGQVLRIEQPPHPVALQGDAVRLAQVLANLVNNASKFSPAGEFILLSADVDGAEVVIRVKDRGCGIAPSFLPHVFDLFVQGEQPLDRSQGGLGIGLTLVRHLVELHGGGVQAFSDGPGTGCEVVVRLPAGCVDGDGGHREADAPGQAAPVRGSPQSRVLVVDDLNASAQTLQVLLEMEGHEVRVAHDGPQALALAPAFGPDVVLLDIGLPGMDGFELARRLRALQATRGALLVALTGYGEAASRQRSAQAGIDVHLVKPADVGQLLALLQDPRAARMRH